MPGRKCIANSIAVANTTSHVYRFSEYISTAMRTARNKKPELVPLKNKEIKPVINTWMKNWSESA